jgi:hypothetical protein
VSTFQTAADIRLAIAQVRAQIVARGRDPLDTAIPTAHELDIRVEWLRDSLCALLATWRDEFFLDYCRARQEQDEAYRVAQAACRERTLRKAEVAALEAEAALAQATPGTFQHDLAHMAYQSAMRSLRLAHGLEPHPFTAPPAGRTTALPMQTAGGATSSGAPA